jgi:tetratricopeptide (TPR) repeat protein
VAGFNRPDIRAIPVLVFCVIILALGHSVHARGREDDSLAYVDSLISKKQYSEAIQALTAYMRANPDDFDRARERIRRITAAREGYNTLTGELLDIIAEDPGSVDRILDLTRRLEDMEASGNSQTGDFITRARDFARFAVNRGKLEEVLARGQALGEAGDYAGALLAYGEGLDIYQEEFFTQGCGAELENQVRGHISRLTGGVELFRSAVVRLGEELGDPPPGPSPGPEDLTALFDRIGPELRALIGLRGGVDGTGRYFLEQLGFIREMDAGTGDRNFLSFASRLIYGQNGDGTRNGMLHGIDSYWAYRIGTLDSLVSVPAAAAYEKALAAARRGDHRAAETGFAEAAAYGALERDLLELEGLFARESRRPAGRVDGVSVPAGEIFNFYALLSRDFAAARARDAERLELALDRFARELAGIPAEAPAESPVEAPAGEESPGETERLRGTFNGFIAEAGGKIAELRDKAGELAEELAGVSPADTGRSAADTERAAAEVLRYTGEAVELLEKFRSRCLDTELDWARRRYTALNGDLRRRLELRRAEFSVADRLLAGLTRESGPEFPEIPEFPAPPGVPAGGSTGEPASDPAAEPGSGGEPGSAGDPGYRYYYPREALARFNPALDLVDGDIRRGAEVLSRYDGERPEFLSAGGPAASGDPAEPAGPGGLGPLRDATRSLVESLEELRRRGDGAVRDASERIARAELFRARGDQYYREAGAAVGRGDYGAARARIQGAAESYNRSLSFQESAGLRREWDTRMLALGQAIGQGENEIVIREVREIVNQARGEYFAENFDSAEKLLMRGQSRWNVTNAEENPEISYWLSMVRGALSLRSGRVIPVTAPLFAEMGQLLSEARGNFERGYALIRANRGSEGIALFNEARRKTRKVKLMFPMNREAGILELRMDQVTDPEAFAASFQRRLNEAVAGVERRSAESFADLQNLAELEPRYPGVARALWQAEIVMGRRIAPPDPAILRRSGELTLAARAIVDANDRDHFEAALRQLNEALSLNPNNDEAMTLKDRVQARMGTGNAVLSSADEGDYQRAVMELQRGNTLTALSLVERLLQNSQNRNSTRIIDLRRKIEAIL